jgi:hypothetical protein
MAFRDKYDEVTNKKAMKYYNRRKRAYRKRGGKPTPIRYSYALNPIPKKQGRFWGRRRLTGESQSPNVISQSQGSQRSRSAPNSPAARKRIKFERTPQIMSGIVEKKTHWLNATTSLLDVGSIYSGQLYNIGQGVLQGNRIGSRIRATTININGTLRNRVTAKAIGIRVLVVHDKKPQFGALTTNLFIPKGDSNQPTDFNTGGDFSQMNAPINKTRFRVLSDRKILLAPFTSQNQGHEAKLINYFVKINRNVSYLNEGTLSTREKINPNLHLIYFVEQEESTTGNDTAEVLMNVYQHFHG